MERYRHDPAVLASMEASAVPFAVYQYIDRRVVTLVLSAGFCKLFGYRDRAIAYSDMDNDMYKDTHPDDVARIAEAAVRFANEEAGYDVLYRTKVHPGGGYRVVHAIGEHVYADTGERLAYVWYTDEGPCPGEQASAACLDPRRIRELHMQSELRRNHYDFLTGLPAMDYFFELVGAGRERIRERGEVTALLYIDLSGIKYYNRRHGFEGGNQLLRSFARLLVRHFSAENCSRFGQDHFAVYTSATSLDSRLERLFQDSAALNDGDNLPVRVGIYLDRTGRTDINAACDRAKFACDLDRKAYRSVYRYFDDKMLTNVRMRQHIIDNLDRALDEGWVQIYYQPIVRTSNGRVCNEEALARWVDPEKGILSPADFITILEDAMLIYRLDLYVVDRVLEKLKQQAEAGLYVVPQSVNLSRVDFNSCDIVDEICRRVDAAGLGHDKLSIEITESTVGNDFEFIKQQVNRFRELGFPVWMDDFGSGYSSLDLLQNIHFDLIKFDMRFMQQFNSSNGSKIIITELMKIAMGLGIETVVEGVETREQLEFLREVGCAKIQGFYYGKAIPLQEILLRYEQGRQIGLENPLESAYYEAIGRISLYDPTMITNANIGENSYFFNSIPMAILEMRDDEVRILRCNHSYRVFVARMLGVKLPEGEINNTLLDEQPDDDFMRNVRRCLETDEWITSDSRTDGEIKLYSFLRKTAENPVNGAVAITVVVMAIMN